MPQRSPSGDLDSQAGAGSTAEMAPGTVAVGDRDDRRILRRARLDDGEGVLARHVARDV
jgi:hypothetical protein